MMEIIHPYLLCYKRQLVILAAEDDDPLDIFRKIQFSPADGPRQVNIPSGLRTSVRVAREDVNTF